MEIKQIYKAMTSILQEVEAITKDQTNEQQKYKFRGIDDVYNALHPLFKKHKVFTTPEVLEERRETVTVKGVNGAPDKSRFYCFLKVRFTYFAEDGSSITSVMSGEGMDSGDKATNKAMSAAQKYSLIQMFLIPTKDGLPDSDKHAESDMETSEVDNYKNEALKFTDVDNLREWANDNDLYKHPELKVFVADLVKKLKKPVK